MLETVIIKAGLVIGKEHWIPEWVVGVSRLAIRVDGLAAAMVDCAVGGSGSGTLGNGELRRRGGGLLVK